MDVVDRFERHVIRTDQCHSWIGAIDSWGYGRFAINPNRRSITASRAAWILFKGSIEPDSFVLHKCKMKNCVNIDHLYLGTQKDNMADAMRDGTSIAAQRKASVRCSNGHNYSAQNTRWVVDKSKSTVRRCRKCEAAASRRYKERKNLR